MLGQQQTMTQKTFALPILVFLVASLVTVAAQASDTLPDGRSASTAFPLMLDVFSGATPILNGLRVRSGNSTLEVSALRDDVLRVRATPEGGLPEDASWAVLSTARQSSVEVIAESNPDFVGFRTRALRVTISRRDLHLLVADLDGNVLQEDANGWPVVYHGQDFRI